MENIQTFIRDQLQVLRSEMLKFDDVLAESRKHQDLNAALNIQLAAERKEAQEMNSKIATLGRQEQELKEQKVQIERRLAEANDKVRDQNTDMSARQNDTEDLRRQLKSVEDKLSAATAEIERLQKNTQTRDKKIADYGVSCFIPLRVALLILRRNPFEY